MTEYLGRVNEATDEILSRKMIVSAAEFDGALRARRFGDSYALIKIAENIGLRDNLFDAFGGDGDHFQNIPKERRMRCSPATTLAWSTK